jgi:(p)ppGpp synthase/HD superfamily hydrolase
MHRRAQTNVQLYNQLRDAGYSSADLKLVRNAYELAMVLFAARYQPSGKSFMAHVVGTASILASLGLPASVVAAGLLHNVYKHGDFGDGASKFSVTRKHNISRVLGSEVAEYAARFRALPWDSPTIQLARTNMDQLGSADRHVILIRLADQLEHISDLDHLYYGESVRQRYVGATPIAIELAEKMGFAALALELERVSQEWKSAGPPVEPPVRVKHNVSFVIAPRSYRKRFVVLIREHLISIRQVLRRRLWLWRKFLFENGKRVQKVLLGSQR